MTSAVLIPGAGGLGWYWHLVERHLKDQGYDAVTVDLAASGRTGLPAYADAIVAAIDGRADVALIAQSMGAFTGTAGLAACPDQRGRVRERDDPATRRDAGSMVGQRRLRAGQERQRPFAMATAPILT